MIYVIGSGPAGISSARALLDQGLTVTLLDAGNELEAERARAVDLLRSADPGSWHGKRVEFLKKNVAPDRKGVGLKYVYGSDFPYRDVEVLASLKRTRADTTPSLARGGFSNVWGAAILPYIASDIDAWPISINDLVPHYRAILAGMDVSATDDDLARVFPLYTDRHHPLRASRQAQSLLADMGRSKPRLNDAGISFGASRLAVRALPRNDAGGCVYCGLCMYGCPNNLIYNSGSYLPDLLRNPNFKYVPNVVVTQLEEFAGGIRIKGKRKGGAKLDDLIADRVYLACGVISSTQILLESLGEFDKPVRLLDSCYFLLPMLRAYATRNVADEPLHTLAQAFIEIMDPAVSGRTVHLQLYTFNDLYIGAIRKIVGPLYPLVKVGANAVLSRLLVLQGYLHSDYSPSLKLTLSRAAGDAGRQLSIEGEPAASETVAMLRRVSKKLWKNRRSFGAFPVPPMLHVPAPGRGFHSGGTFPMNDKPAGFQTDTLGRPVGFRRVHVVDSTSLPSIPATTITLSVMANAHRIASRYHDT
jgi:choline dehydrogenase-like flavoprotein